MKLTILLILSCLSCFQSFGQDYETLYVDNAPTIESDFYASIRFSEQEINYISENVSNVRVRKHLDRVYISWSVCDDMTYSEYFVIKTQNDKTYEVTKIRNFPNNIGIPLLFSTIDSTDVNTTSVYKLFKISENGYIKHIVTVLLPVYSAPATQEKKVKKKLKLNMQVELKKNEYGYKN